jgi:hypothetical protein
MNGELYVENVTRYRIVTFILCIFSLNHRQVTKPYGEVEIELPAFLTSKPEKGDLSGSRLRFFAPGKSAPLKSNLGGLHRPSGNLGEDTNL